MLREYGPLKQGLRLPYISATLGVCSSPRVWSTKTRIKTQQAESQDIYHVALREYGPLKQGLRPSSNIYKLHNNRLREYGPLKQGLRLCEIFVKTNVT